MCINLLRKGRINFDYFKEFTSIIILESKFEDLVRRLLRGHCKSILQAF